MDLQNKQLKVVWPIKAPEPRKQTETPGRNAAKVSIIAAVIVIGLNWAEITVFEGKPGVLAMAGYVALASVIAGIAAGAAALVMARHCAVKGVILLASAGLLLNGVLIATGFVKAPMLGRRDAGAKKVSAKGSETRPVTLKNGRTIVTQDWTAGGVFEVTDSTFDTVIGETDMPIVIDFWAPWCGPCRMMGPVIEEIARDFKGRAKVYKLNTDNSRVITGRYGITSIPTIILFKGGRLQKKWIGVTDKEAISGSIERKL